MELKRSLFITIEGGEGSGKTTLAKNLVEHYKAQGINAIYTREPGGIKEAEEIRNIVVNNDLPQMEQLLLFAACRKLNLDRIIKPALQQPNTLIICDRYVTSSIVYQGLVGRLGEYAVKNVMNMIGAIDSDFEFILGVDPEVGMKRACSAGREINLNDTKGIEFHKQINDAYKYIVERFFATHGYDKNKIFINTTHFDESYIRDYAINYINTFIINIEDV